MENDEEVAVISINSLGIGREVIDSSWQDFSSLNDLYINDGDGNDQEETPQNGKTSNIIENDLEFLKKHVTDADPEFLSSLLNSQSDNPKRLEMVMCEVLNIPNALELIREFRRNNAKPGNKRANNDYKVESEECKKKKSGDTESYLQQIRDMFPDVDGLFLISECQQLESWEDCSRFINTVMISGLYPKKEVVEYTPTGDPPKMVEIIDKNEYRTVEVVISEDEISSSGLVDSPKKQRKKRKSRNSTGDSPRPSTSRSNELLPGEVEVVDIASDNTESYEPPDLETLREIYSNSEFAGSVMDVDEANSILGNNWETSLLDDVSNLLETKFGPQVIVNNVERKDSLPAIPGPSEVRTPRKPSSSLDDAFIQEKSLAEIIEEGRFDHRHSLDSLARVPLVNNPPLEKIKEASSSEVSSPEVTTTSRPTGNDSDEATFVEEVEEASKVTEEWLDEQTLNLIRIFPNADPSFLRERVTQMNGSMEAVSEFVICKLERNDMPTRAEYEKRLEMEELQNRYTKNFSIEDFLKVLPDPWKYFTEGNRNCAKYKSHSLCYLKSAFRKHYVRDIIDAFGRNNYNLYATYQELKKLPVGRRGRRRSEFECNSHRPTTIDIQFLQEVAFIENEEKIKDHIEGEKIEKQIKFDEAKRTGSLLECQCCFDSEVMVEDIVYCPKDHSFCKDCIIKCVEVEMGNGKCTFECLTSCDEKFSLACLQNVLKPELFSKVIQANQMEEIRAAEIEDLVQCPFCNYATIMPPEEKVMTCLNPECLKESCRLCKELNHIPLRCDEVEKSEEVKLRTYIENKMTEALVRTCYKCGKKFVKEDGCNKMTCTCGAKMCYVCRKPVSDYSHFNGQGGIEYHKCPLYSTNDELHVDLVRQIGEEAKAQVLCSNPHVRLIHDPTVIMPEKTHERPMPGMNNGAALSAGLRAARRMLSEEGEETPNEEGEHHQHHNQPYYHHHHHQHHHHHHHQRHHRNENLLWNNPYYNRYHQHRRRTLLDSEDEEELNRHHHHHHHHERNHNHRHRLQQEVREHRNRFYRHNP